MEPETKLYKRRWFYLLLLCILKSLTMFLFICFGQVSDVYVNYLNRSHVEVDWFFNIQSVGSLVFSPFASVLALGRYGKPNCFLAIAGIATTLAALSIVALGINSSMYPVAMIGLFFNGVSLHIMWVIKAAFPYHMASLFCRFTYVLYYY